MKNFLRRATLGLDIESNANVLSGAEINVAGINPIVISDLLTGSNELGNGSGFERNDVIIVNRARITTLPNLLSFGANLCFPVHLGVGMESLFPVDIEKLTITVENLGEWVDVGMPLYNRNPPNLASSFILLDSDNAKIYCGTNIPAFLEGVELILNFELDVSYNRGKI